MNKKIIYLAIALAVAISAAAFVFSKKSYTPGESSPVMNSETQSGATAPAESSNSSASPADNAQDVSGSATQGGSTSSGPSLPVNEEASPGSKKWEDIPLSAKELKSVRTMSTLLVKFLDPKMGNPELLVKEFNKAGMQAVMAKDFNQYTGKMIVVRCNNPPEGTRCCHAQYFEDENKKSFLQHMSFEVKPGKGAMEQVVTSLETALKPLNLGKLGKPVSKTEDKVHWDLGEEYTATVMRLKSSDDLKNDPFCAHDPETDRGSYKVMVEMAPEENHN